MTRTENGNPNISPRRTRRLGGALRALSLIPLALAGKKAEAQRLALGIQRERSEKMREIVDGIIVSIENITEEHLKQTQQTTADSLRLFVVLGLR